MHLLGLIVFQMGPDEPNKEGDSITLLPPSNKNRNYFAISSYLRITLCSHNIWVAGSLGADINIRFLIVVNCAAKKWSCAICTLRLQLLFFLFFCAFCEFSLAIGPMTQTSVLALNFSQAIELTSFHLEASLFDMSLKKKIQ